MSIASSAHPPTVLAIDTSCDDTAAAVVSGRVVLSNVVASQTQLHKPYGGVFPTVAKQAHLENWPRTVELAIQKSGLSWSHIDGIAVTVGPGLAPALEVGITAAKELATLHAAPLIPINHLEAHAWSSQAVAKPKQWAKISPDEQRAYAELITPQFPVLAIIVSGGHTQFVQINAFGDYTLLGQTLDDAAGECLDKVGRMLSLGYPAGPVVEQFARMGNEKAFRFPLPMTTTDSFDLSYSGIKTHSRQAVAELEAKQQLNAQTTYDFCASLQRGVFTHLTYKLEKLLTHTTSTTATAYRVVWLGGGVAANQKLRQMLRTTLKPFGLSLAVPYSKRLCGDNAAMIGLVGVWKIKHGLTENEIAIERQPRLSLGTPPKNTPAITES